MKEVISKESEVFSLVGRLSDDGMKLFLDAAPKPAPGGGVVYHTLSRKDLLNLLSPEIPEALLELSVIDDIALNLSKGLPVKERRIAKGHEPVPGPDGKVLLLVKPLDEGGTVHVDQKGYAKFAELHLFDSVRVQQVIGRVYPPKAGHDGIDAMGRAKAAKAGAPARYTLDPSIVLTSSGRSDDPYECLISQHDGYVAVENGRYSVKEELVINGDLDYHFGNLQFIGKVRITGSVMPGFSVSADKGIDIGGAIQGGQFTSSQGDVQIKGFAFGGKGGRVIAANQVHFGIAHEVHAEAGSGIFVRKEAIDCTFHSRSTISLPSGALIGGVAYTVCGLEARTIGNESGRETIIELCSEVEASAEYSKVSKSIDAHQDAIRLMKLHLGPFADARIRVQRLAADHRKKIERLLDKLDQVTRSLSSLERARAELLVNSKQSSKVRVNIESHLFPGAIIRAGKEEFSPKEAVTGPCSIVFDVSTRTFSVGERSPLECAMEEVKKDVNVKDTLKGEKP